jgi:hypothetical protein
MTRGIQSTETGSDLFFLRKGCRANEEIGAGKSRAFIVGKAKYLQNSLENSYSLRGFLKYFL